MEERELKHSDPSRAAMQFERMFPHASSECLDHGSKHPTSVSYHEPGLLISINVYHYNESGTIEDIERVVRNEEGKFITKDGREIREIDEGEVIR